MKVFIYCAPIMNHEATETRTKQLTQGQTAKIETHFVLTPKSLPLLLTRVAIYLLLKINRG